MAAVAEKPVVEVPEDTDKHAMICRAYSEIGGRPKNHLKTNAFKVGPSAWRVNIYVEVPSECFIKSARIEHSFYFKD